MQNIREINCFIQFHAKICKNVLFAKQIILAVNVFTNYFSLDGMVTNRDDSSSGNGVQERVLSVLLNEMDGIGGSNPNQCEVSWFHDTNSTQISAFFASTSL